MEKLDNSPTISVMMPTFNAIHYVDSAVLSVMSQTYPNWELLAYDDGSEDGTYERMKFWAQLDERIKAAQPFQEPRQYANLCNQMLADANGEYMARIDCDDISLPERLSNQLDFIRDNRSAVLVGTMLALIMESEGGKIVNDHPIVDAVKKTASTQQPINEAIKEHHKVVHGGTFLARTQQMIESGGYDNMLPLDDWDVSLRMAEQGNIYVLSKMLYLKRIHKASASEKHPGRQQAFGAIKEKYRLNMTELPVL